MIQFVGVGAGQMLGDDLKTLPAASQCLATSHYSVQVRDHQPRQQRGREYPPHCVRERDEALLPLRIRETSS